MNQPGMQHVEFEWDFYPGRQRAVIAGEAERAARRAEGLAVRSPGPRPPTCTGAAECLWEPAVAREEGHGGWYLCKSPSLASKKFTVYLTDLAIRIRMSNVSWERPQG